MVHQPIKPTMKAKHESQEARVFAALQSGRIVPHAELLALLYPPPATLPGVGRSPVGSVIRRIRDRGYDVKSVEGVGYQIVGAEPHALPIDVSATAKPAPERPAQRECKRCRKPFKPEGRWITRCDKCHERERELGSDITLGAW